MTPAKSVRTPRTQALRAAGFNETMTTMVFFSAVIVAVAALGMHLGCEAATRVGSDRAARHVGSEPAARCGIVDDVGSLERSPSVLYRGAILRSDRGFRQLATLWPPTQRFTQIMQAAIDRRELGVAFGDTSIDFEAHRNHPSSS